MIDPATLPKGENGLLSEPPDDAPDEVKTAFMRAVAAQTATILHDFANGKGALNLTAIRDAAAIIDICIGYDRDTASFKPLEGSPQPNLA